MHQENAVLYVQYTVQWSSQYHTDSHYHYTVLLYTTVLSVNYSIVQNISTVQFHKRKEIKHIVQSFQTHFRAKHPSQYSKTEILVMENPEEILEELYCKCCLNILYLHFSVHLS